MQPDQVLMLVTHHDIQAASAAGVGMIAVRCGMDDADLAGAKAIYDLLLIFGSLRRFAARQNRIRTGRSRELSCSQPNSRFIIALRFVRKEMNNKTQTNFSGYPVSSLVF